MNFLSPFALLFFLVVNFSFAQQVNVLDLKNQNLLDNANSVVLNQQKNITIDSQNLMQVKTTRKVLILNELGEKNIDAFLYYDSKTKIKSMILSIYLPNESKPIKVIKEKDFEDYNASDGFSIVTDNRIKISGYQHVVSYPFIAEFHVEYTTSNTAHIPGFHAIENDYENVLYSQFQISYADNLGFNKIEKNLQSYSAITATQTQNLLTYTVKNLLYSEKEQSSLSYTNTMPHVLFGLQKFTLEGVEGNVKTWEDFGKWYYSNFIQNQQTLPAATVAKVKQLTATISDPIQKAKVLYAYMQSKTRYISIQLGIGGWKPFPANYVDANGFGDCKALSNYMAALLKAADVEAYVVLVKAGSGFEDIHDEMVSVQGNHMILALPNGSDYTFIECTSQTAPFSYITNFTDGRKVIIVKPTGAIIYKTPAQLNHANLQKTKGVINVDEFGAITSELAILNQGTFFDACQSFPSLKAEDVTKMVKSRYDLIKSMNDVSFSFTNDVENIVFTENYTIKTKPHLKKMGNQFMLPLNLIHPLLFIPKNYKERKFDFTTGRGYLYEDELVIKLPEQAEITFLPEPKNIISEYGDYVLDITKNQNKIIVKRKFLLKADIYSKAAYHDYKKFREDVAQYESLKLTYKLLPN